LCMELWTTCTVVHIATEIPTIFESWCTFEFPAVRPSSDLEGLMASHPFTEADGTSVALQVLREAIAECIEQLSDEDQFVIEAIWFERVTVRALADRLGLHKSRTHRMCQRAVIRLGDIASTHPVLMARYVAA
jgi:DNA-directed RNA polymerase specialized sigma24 family protein